MIAPISDQGWRRLDKPLHPRFFYCRICSDLETNFDKLSLRLISDVAKAPNIKAPLLLEN